jgi:hypothetical protein
LSQDWEHTVDPLAARGQTVNYLSLLAQIKSLPSDAIATPLDKAVAYSGPATSGRTSNRRKALEYSRVHDLVPIDFTPAGQWLDQQHLYDSSSVTANQATWLWSALSERYMGEAKGTITAFVEGHAPDRVFSRVELRSFVENLSLVGIQYLDLDRKRKLVWVAREFLEKAARAEGLTFEQAALHSASPDTRIPENQLRLYDLSFPVHRLLSSIIGRAPHLKTSPLGEAHELLVSQLDQIRVLYIKDEVRSATVQLAVARVLDLQRFPSLYDAPSTWRSSVF